MQGIGWRGSITVFKLALSPFGGKIDNIILKRSVGSQVPYFIIIYGEMKEWRKRSCVCVCFLILFCGFCLGGGGQLKQFKTV